MPCRDCGAAEARVTLGGVEVCDRCCDWRIAEHTGFARLPDPPPPLSFDDPDGRQHRLAFRVWRAPTGIKVELEETGVPEGEGFRFAVLGDHEADVDTLVQRVKVLAEREVAHPYLEPASHREGWATVGDEVAGRLVWNDEGVDGRPFNVVIDGRTLTWEELGCALESYEGWSFRLVIESSIDDTRGDAEVIKLMSDPSTGASDGG